MLKEKIYFVAAVGTDIGKTFLVENLCKILPKSSAIKPISSGFDDDSYESDCAKILSALGLENSKNNRILYLNIHHLNKKKINFYSLKLLVA